jgi:hypothetical protein
MAQLSGRDREVPVSDTPAMNGTDRHAIKLLVDRAARAKIQAQATDRVRLYRRTRAVEPVQTIFFPIGVAVEG